ncbi:hypothetical protein SAY87_005597 [Trapa incisa]|uniref:Uncharacterized protein n=1 Tax=Trapa incisa TaxID=236973 RepID=A0AAN7K6E1_9MYRT|nr:hypothetical protein SAY87_005597 [Trapa incisa]
MELVHRFTGSQFDQISTGVTSKKPSNSLSLILRPNHREVPIMATVAMEAKKPEWIPVPENICSAKLASKQGEGLRHYYVQRIHDLQLLVRQKVNNLNRLEAQRNELNSRVRMLREELQLLQEPGSYVGEVVKVMGKNKVLVKVLMATNRIDILDQALLRPGRIDRKIEFPNPNEESRQDILKIHSRKMNLMRGIDLKKIAEKMNGASGAELKAVCTEAGMFALRERRVHVTQEDFEMAVAKVMKKETEKNMSLRKLWK